MTRITHNAPSAAAQFSCACLGRGYTVDMAHFVACTCEAGIVWADKHADQVAAYNRTHRPELAAAAVEQEAATAAQPPVVLNKTRASEAFSGLTYEIRTTKSGYYLVFRMGGTFDAFALQEGTAHWADCSDRGCFSAEVSKHVRQVAAALAIKLTGVAVRKAA